MTDKNMATADQMALARRVVNGLGLLPPGMVSAGMLDGHAILIATVAAIIETTGRAAKLAESRTSDDPSEDWETGDEASFCIAADLRAGNHLKGTDHG